MEILSEGKIHFPSAQSMRISTAIAVAIFNEGELCLYALMRDLKLNPSYVSFRSICKREHIKKQYGIYTKKANVHRRARRQKLTQLRREQQLLRLEGGRSYKSSNFGAKTFTKPSKPRRARGSSGASTTKTYRGIACNSKGVKLSLIRPSESESSISDTDSSNDKESNTIPKDICEICQLQTLHRRDINPSQYGPE